MDHQFDESYPFVYIGHVCWCLGPVWSRKSVMSAKESSTFISVSVCYSLACHAGVKVGIPGSIHLVLARNLIKGNTIFFRAVDHCRSWTQWRRSRTLILRSNNQQSIAELFSVDNLPNVVQHFFQKFCLPQKVNDATRRTNWITIIVICPRRGVKQWVEQLYTVSVYIRNIQCTNNYCWGFTVYPL